jgi:2-keto-4-pentenoate hydratase/2-oxohepta-3-ene-1,7-dioic acid hydratase in catechol pathway
VLIARVKHGGRTLYGEVDGDTVHLLGGDVYASPVRTEEILPLRDVSLLSPSDPGTLLIMLGGFVKPGTTLAPEARPNVMAKVVKSVTGDGSAIRIPPFTTTNPYVEAELAIVIGKTVRNASVEEAREAIWGYTCFNDVTAPEFMIDFENGALRPDPHLFAAKSHETFAVMGPWVRTDLGDDEIAEGLQITCRVNGNAIAGGNTLTQKWPGSVVLSYISRYVQLEPGDVIALGTPQPCEAGPGDTVEVEVEGIGTLTNTVEAA